MKRVTDPALLAQLDTEEISAPAADGARKPVTDPALLAELDKPAPERTVLEKAGRAVGLTARAGIEGVTAIPAMLANAPAALYNKVAAFMSPPTLAGQITGERGFRFPDQSQFGATIADKIGLPRTENATERVVGDVAGSMAGAGGMVKAGANLAEKGGTEIAKRIGALLASNPSTQIVASGTGTGAGSVVREEGGGPGAQLAANVAATMLPSASTGIAEMVKRAVRGGEAGRLRVADTIQAFEDAGAGTPTVGQVTQGRGARAVESGLSKSPGAAGRMVAKAEAEAAGIGDKVDEIASSFSTRSGAAPAGREIRAGLGRFADGFKKQSGKLYDELDTHIAKDARIDVSATQRALSVLNAEIPGAPNLSRFFQNAKMQGIKGALDADTLGEANVISRMSPIEKAMFGEVPSAARTAMIQEFEDGKLPYEALKKLRTLVGHEISNSNLVSDVPRSKWKALYGALSEDLESAAKAAGPQAEKAFGRANSYYSAGMKRIDDVLDPILKKTDPEDVFKAAVSGTSEGATTIRGVMKSLPEESRKIVASTTLRRLGRAVNSKQDDLGEVFSTETFLTNWNKITPDSKTALFAALPDEMRKDLDKIARVASNIRDGSKVFANPSGTAQAASNQLTAGAAAISLLTGNWPVAAAIAGGVASAAASSRLMTSPDFVRWLAKSTRVPVEQLPAQLNVLSQAIFRMDEGEREEAKQFVKTAREALRTAEGRPNR